MLSTHISHQIYAKLSFDATFNQKKIIEKLSQWLADPDYMRLRRAKVTTPTLRVALVVIPLPLRHLCFVATSRWW